MEITRTYKFRLKPTAEQEERLDRACAAVRMIYNAANEQRITYARKQGTDAHGRSSFFNKNRQSKELGLRASKQELFGDYISRAQQIAMFEECESLREKKHVKGEAEKERKDPKYKVKEFQKREFKMSIVRGSSLGNATGLANDPDLCWVDAYIDSDAAGYALDALDQAWDAFYKGKVKKFPAFRNAQQDNTLKYRAYRKTKKPAYVVYGKDCVTIPKIGKVPYVKHVKLRRLQLQTATVTKEGDKWYICVATTRTVKERAVVAPAYAGIDLGTINPIVVADTSGEAWMPREVLTLRTSKDLTERQKRVQQEISRGKKGSKRRRRKVAELARLRRKESTRKRMGLHQITTSLVREFTHIGIEDLKNKEMTASAKSRRKAGKKTKPNKAQAAINRAYLDVPKYMFRQQLEYKAAGMGRHVLAVDPKNTSATCKVCGNVSQASRPNRGERYSCTSCGHEEHADAMAAFNILNKAFPNHRLTMVGVSGAVAGPLKTPLIGGNSEKCKSVGLGLLQNPASSNPIVSGLNGQPSAARYPAESTAKGRGGFSFLKHTREDQPDKTNGCGGIG